MKRLLFASFAATLCMSIGNEARAYEWSGAQIMVPVSVSAPFDDSPYGFRGMVASFFIPSDGSHLIFAYAGMTYDAVKTDDVLIRLNPQMVGAFGFFDGDTDAFGPSLAALIASQGGRIQLFGQGELYFTGDGQRAFYGYYALDAAPVPWLNLGLQAEQIDSEYTIGPHVGFGGGPANFGLQYHIGEEAHTLRFVTALNF